VADGYYGKVSSGNVYIKATFGEKYANCKVVFSFLYNAKEWVDDSMAIGGDEKMMWLGICKSVKKSWTLIVAG
jgi:hypothetical protein